LGVKCPQRGQLPPRGVSWLRFASRVGVARLAICSDGASMTTQLQNAPLDCISRVRFAGQASRTHLLVSSWDSQVRLYDVQTGFMAGVHKHNLPVLDCTFLGHDASRAVSVGLDGWVKCFDFNAQQEMPLGRHDEPVRCVEFDLSTSMVVTGSWDRTIRLWDTRSGAQPRVMNVGTKVLSLDVGATQICMAGADRHMHIYDKRRLDAPVDRRESPLKHQLRCVKVSVDQRSYASGSVEGRVSIEYFDHQENGNLKYAFKCHRSKSPSGEEAIHAVNALAFHPIHGTFATGGSDGGVCVWDGYAKKRLWRMDPFNNPVSSLGFSADGSMLAVGVSYTFDNGDNPAAPAPEVHVRFIQDAEVLPKSKTG